MRSAFPVRLRVESMELPPCSSGQAGRVRQLTASKPASGDYRVNSTFERVRWRFAWIPFLQVLIRTESSCRSSRLVVGTTGCGRHEASAVIIHASAYNPTLLPLRLRVSSHVCARSESESIEGSLPWCRGLTPVRSSTDPSYEWPHADSLSALRWAIAAW